jgi:hypothetical protein
VPERRRIRTLSALPFNGPPDNYYHRYSYGFPHMVGEQSSMIKLAWAIERGSLGRVSDCFYGCWEQIVAVWCAPGAGFLRGLVRAVRG